MPIPIDHCHPHPHHNHGYGNLGNWDGFGKLDQEHEQDGCDEDDEAIKPNSVFVL
jgi:hypothetical protein